MNRLTLGLSAVLVLAIGLAGGYLFVPKTMGSVSYDKTYLNTLDVSGETVLHATTITGALSTTGVLTNTGNASIVGDVNVDDSNATSTISAGNTGVGKLCLWNGTQYSVLSFTAGSTTASIATSTACN